MTWEPITLSELRELMAPALAEADQDVRAGWEEIAISPEKWRSSPYGDDGGGFWVVAIEGSRILWYNDIEDGFNWGSFLSRGKIAEYTCNQDEFCHILACLPATRATHDAHAGWPEEKATLPSGPGKS